MVPPPPDATPAHLDPVTEAALRRRARQLHTRLQLGAPAQDASSAGGAAASAELLSALQRIIPGEP
jgi:hypothetical protein